MLFLNLTNLTPADPETDVDVEVTSDEEVMLEPPFRILIHNNDVTNPVRVITFSAVLSTDPDTLRSDLANELFANVGLSVLA